MLIAFITLVRDPRKTDRVFELSSALRTRFGDRAAASLSYILDHPAFKKNHTDEYNPRIDLSALKLLPEGSFGRETANFLERNGFEPNAFPLIGSREPLDYLVSRLRQTHDLWHVLTGYQTDVPGELALQGFILAQVRSLFPITLITGGMLHTLIFKPFEAVQTFERIIEGYTRGKQCQMIALIRLENEWNTPLIELRAKLGLPPLSNNETRPVVSAELHRQ